MPSKPHGSNAIDLIARAARRICCIGALIASAPAAEALEFELMPALGYRFGGQFEDPAGAASVDVEESPSLALAFDVGYSPGQAIELFYSRQQTEVDDAGAGFDLDIEYFQVGGVATFATESAFEPFAVGTVGAARFSPGRGLEDETRFAATLGGGVRYPLGSNLALRFEARGYFAFFDSDAALFCVSDEAGAECRLRAKGSVTWQVEAQAGIAFRF